MNFTAGSGISASEIGFHTDMMRTELINSGQFDVISNDQLQTMMKTQSMKQKIGLGSCTSDKCLIDLGNALESSKMVVGSVSSEFGVYAISIKLLDVVKQKYEKAAQVTITEKSQFPNAAREAVQQLLGKKIPDRKPERTEPVNREALVLDAGDRNSYLRIALISSGFGDAELQKYYGESGSNLMIEWLFYNQRLPYDIDPYIRFTLKSFETIPGLFPSVGTLDIYMFDAGMRWNAITFKFLFRFQLYLTGSLTYALVNEQAANGISMSHSSMGAMTGAGIDIGWGSYFSFFVDFNIGYIPVGNSGKNIAGNDILMGMSLRL